MLVDAYKMLGLHCQNVNTLALHIEISNLKTQAIKFTDGYQSKLS